MSLFRAKSQGKSSEQQCFRHAVVSSIGQTGGPSRMDAIRFTFPKAHATDSLEPNTTDRPEGTRRHACGRTIQATF